LKKVPNKFVAKYMGMVANLDANVGRLMNHLDKRGLSKNTIVIFMNDNGGTIGVDTWNAGMRGCKLTVWQGGWRAMSFWRWPGKWRPHGVDTLAAHVDVLPTVCDVAGVTVPAGVRKQLEGVSLRPFLESKKSNRLDDDRIVIHHGGRWKHGTAALHKYCSASVSYKHYLLIRSQGCEVNNPEDACNILRQVANGTMRTQLYTDNPKFHFAATPPGRWSLFDLKQDVGCTKDLSAQQPGLVWTLSDAYEQWWDDVYPEMIREGGDGPVHVPPKGLNK
jgi:arylsulfatase A-like enzyme